MTHLSLEDLKSWRDGEAAADRARIVGHLGACDVCGARYAELMRTRPAEAGPTVLNPEDFVARGLRVRRTPLLRRWMPDIELSDWRLEVAAVAAIAILAVAIWQGRPAPAPEAVRGSGVQLIAPEGIVRPPLVFQWTSTLAAPRYRIEILSTDGAVVYSGNVMNDRIDLTEPLRGRLQPGQEYSWRITALDADGTPIIESTARIFRLAGAS